MVKVDLWTLQPSQSKIEHLINKYKAKLQRQRKKVIDYNVTHNKFEGIYKITIEFLLA